MADRPKEGNRIQHRDPLDRRRRLLMESRMITVERRACCRTNTEPVGPWMAYAWNAPG